MEKVFIYQEDQLDVINEYSSKEWTDISIEGIAKAGGVKFDSGKKPEKLLNRLIDLTTTENDIVLGLSSWKWHNCCCST